MNVVAEYGVFWRYGERQRLGGLKMSQTVKVSDTLSVDWYAGESPHVAVVRKSAGLVRVELSEVKSLVDALAEAASRVAADAAGEPYVDEADLW